MYSRACICLNLRSFNKACVVRYFSAISTNLVHLGHSHWQKTLATKTGFPLFCSLQTAKTLINKTTVLLSLLLTL